MKTWRILRAKLPALLFLICILALISHRYREESGQPVTEETERESLYAAGKLPHETVERFFPGYTRVEQESEVYYRVNAGGETAGAFVVTTPLADEVTGFAGSVPVALAVGPDNRVRGLQLLENGESPGFVKRVAKEGFFDSWNGRTLEEAAALEVEAVSGATMTSAAVKANIGKALAYHLQQEAQAARIPWNTLLKEGAGYVVMLLALLSMFPAAGLKKFRWLLLLASVLILGFWNGYFLSFTLLYGWLMHGVPWSGKLLLPLMALSALVVPLFFGKAYYCSYLCPFGAAQELTGKLRKKKLMWKGRWKKGVKYIRPLYFAVVVGLLLLGTSLDLTLFEPMAAFMFGAAGRWVIAMALVFLVAAVFIPRPWCNYFCLTGQVLEMLRRSKEGKSKKRKTAEWAGAVVLTAVTLWIVWA